MQNSVVKKLESLLNHKKSKSFYAKRLGISLEEVDDLLAQIRGRNIDNSSIKYDYNKGTVDITCYYETPPTPEKIIKDHSIDTTQYKLSGFWSKQKGKGWQVSAYFTKLPEQEKRNKELVEFLKTYSPTHRVVSKKSVIKDKENSYLVFNKQDSHLNKYDIHGENDMPARFREIEARLTTILIKANTCTDLKKVVYILGSDQFNSEWTNTTTKGTPQENILPYQEGFRMICDHEISTINLLLQYTSELEIIFIPGNHDEYVGWHLVTYLEAYFKEQKNVSFNTLPDYTKFIQFNNSAIMLNHGDGMKPEKLAQNFPTLFKDNWSQCDFFYIFTGDKHHEISRSIGDIKFYQIPALSNAKSKWDSKKGHYNSGEMTAFLFTEYRGMTDIYKERL